MTTSAPTESKPKFRLRLLAAALAVPVAVLGVAPAAGATETDPATDTTDSELLPGVPGLPLPIDPDLPGAPDVPADSLISLAGDCVAAIIETVVGVISGAPVPMPDVAELNGEIEQLPGLPLPELPGVELPAPLEGLKPCLDLLSVLGLDLLPELPIDPGLPLPLGEGRTEQ
jgi:hypothetical protein